MDKERLKKTLAKLRKETPKGGSGGKKQSIFWTAPLVDDATTKYEVYLLPWRDQAEYPFKEYWQYFALGKGKDKNGRFKKPPLALRQFGEENDPIQDMIKELLDENDEKSKKLAQKLYPTQVIYIPVIVKGEEKLGPRIWKFSSTLAYESLTEMFIQSEKYGLMNDPANERWVEITISPENKPFPLNKKISKVDPAWDNEPLSEDQEQIDKWLKDVPDVWERSLKYQKLSAEDLKQRLVEWSDSTSKKDVDEKSEGTEKNPPKEDDKEEVNEEKAAPKKRGRGASKKKKVVSKDDAEEALENFKDEDGEDEDEDDDEDL